MHLSQHRKFAKLMQVVHFTDQDLVIALSSLVTPKYIAVKQLDQMMPSDMKKNATMRCNSLRNFMQM